MEKMSLEELLEIHVDVVSATRKKQKLTEASARMLVVTKEQIRRRSYRYLRDVLRDIPGFEVSYQSTSEWGTNLVVRGLSGNHRVVFLLDGHRYNPPGGENVSLFANLPLTFIDRIEVMYGPGSALYGSDAFNGIINIITSPQAQKDHAVASVEQGMYDMVNASLFGSRRFFGIEARLGAHYTRRGQPDMYVRYPEEHTHDLGTGSDGVRLDRVRSSDVDLSRFDADEDGYDLFLLVGTDRANLRFYHREYSLSSSWDRSALGAPFVEEARFGDMQQLLAGSYTFEHGRLRAGTFLDYARYQVSPSSRNIVPSDLGTGSFTLDDHRGGFSSAFRIEEKVDITIKPETMSLTLGASFQDVKVMPISTFSSPWRPDLNSHQQGTFFNYRYYTGPGDVAAVDSNNYVLDTNPALFSERFVLPTVSEIQFQTAAAYSQLLWHPSHLLQLTLGLRWDYSTRFGSTVNPRVAIVSSPFSSSTFKLLYGRAYLEPTPYEVHGVFVTSDQVYTPNTDLQPETLHSVELVWDQDIGSHLRFTTGGFWNRVEETINSTTWTRKYIYIERDATLHRRELLQSINSGEGDFFGSETQVLFSIWRIRSYLNASVVYGNVEVATQRGQMVTQSPEGISNFMLKGGINLEPVRDLHLNVRGCFHSAPNLRFSSSTYLLAGEGEPFFILDASIRYTLRNMWRKGDDVTLFVHGQNLTDSRYKMLSGQPAVNPIGTPQPPLQVMVGLETEVGL